MNPVVAFLGNIVQSSMYLVVQFATHSQALQVDLLVLSLVELFSSGRTISFAIHTLEGIGHYFISALHCGT